MIIPVLLTLGIGAALYASRATSPRALAAQVKEIQVIVDPIKYGSNTPGYAGKSAACANDPQCDAAAVLRGLGYTDLVYRGSDDPTGARFREGREVTFVFNVRGELRADRDAPSWMLFFISPVTPS